MRAKRVMCEDLVRRMISRKAHRVIPLCAITRAVPDRLYPSQYVRFVRMRCGEDAADRLHAR